MKINSVCIANIKKISSLKKVYCGQVKIFGGIANKVRFELETEDYKKDAVLIKIGDNKYIDIDNIVNIWDVLRIFLNLTKSRDIIIETLLLHYASFGDLFIDKENCQFYDLYHDVGILHLSKILKEKKLDKIIVKKYETKF